MPIPLKLTFGAQTPHLGQAKAWSATLASDWLSERIGGWANVYWNPGGYPGEYDPLKPAVWGVPGPLESGVFDKPVETPVTVNAAPAPVPVFEGEYGPPWAPGEERTTGPAPATADESRASTGSVLEGDTMAVDWGEFAEAQVQGLIRGFTGVGGPPVYSVPVGFAGPSPGAVPAPITTPPGAGGGGGGLCPTDSCGPRYLTYDCKTGTFTHRRRRRRGKLLTNEQFNDVLKIGTLPNKEAVRIALAKAIK